MFEKILIANRGEIACRIIKTAQRLGIKTVIVYSEADADTQAVLRADEAYCIGPAPSTESYLNIQKIIAAAKISGAQAIHPGYGFLSENPEMAKACKQAGIIFIGPPARAIEAMGSKSAAKKHMESSSIPVIPGYHGSEQSPEKLLAEARKIGFPVLIKASSGGGGKGMRTVLSENEFLDALNSAKREALTSFGDDMILIEKWLLEPRHVEIQVFCDNQGQGIYLFERDCSIQRRHQKIIEEAPAPHLKNSVREAMGKAAVQAALSIGYIGAGTIEFLLDKDEQFYFMEMNTRLQVEHPVTEMITRQDLVEWQFKIACGEKLPLAQKELSIRGHAIEARIYAEDPKQQFMPSVGRLFYLKPPKETDNIRLDTGFVENDTITPYYDPMIAKLIVWGEDRNTALRRLLQALNQYHIIGVKNNIAFLKKIIEHASFKEGRLSTHFITEHEQSLLRLEETLPPEYLILACLVKLHTHQSASQDPWDGAWQMNLPVKCTFTWLYEDQQYPINTEMQEGKWIFEINNQVYPIEHYYQKNDEAILQVHQKHIHADIFCSLDHIHLFTEKGLFSFTEYRLENAYSQEEHSENQLTAPMPGTVVAVYVTVGQSVQQGDKLIAIEAMKMEHTLFAPHAGIVKAIYFDTGKQVAESDELMHIEHTQ